MISPEAVQAALDAYWRIYGISDGAMEAALAAAFPIMLREVAKLNWLDSYTDQQINEIADSYEKNG